MYINVYIMCYVVVQYIQSIQDLFEKYKTVAGYPDGELEVH